ncbi:toast rack family protein [Neobacillus sp. K501]
MKKVLLGVMAASVMVFASGCGIFAKGNEDSSNVNIDKDKAKELQLELNIGAGELNVSQGADEWVEGSIVYTNKKWEPVVSYERKGKKGIAVIEQEHEGIFNNVKIGEIKNTWDLKLNDQVPIDLQVNSGASETKLDLNGLKIKDLEVNAGVGDITIDLSGKWKESFDVSLDMGVGQSTIILPSDVGVKIEISKGIGEAELSGFISKGNGVYVNEAFEDADVVINVSTELGVGEAEFKLEK